MLAEMVGPSPCQSTGQGSSRGLEPEQPRGRACDGAAGELRPCLPSDRSPVPAPPNPSPGCLASAPTPKVTVGEGTTPTLRCPVPRNRLGETLSCDSSCPPGNWHHSPQSHAQKSHLLLWLEMWGVELQAPAPGWQLSSLTPSLPNPASLMPTSPCQRATFGYTCHPS